MVKHLDPGASSPLEHKGIEELGENMNNLGSVSSAFRWAGREPARERIEAEELISSLTERDQTLEQLGLMRLVIWFLGLIALFALLILLLQGIGMISLPSGLVIALLGSLLSGVLGLLAVLVKYLTRGS
jgi:hypothetical protein